MTSHLNTIRSIIENTEELDSKLPTSKIELETKFRDDLGFDSIQLMTFVYELQEHYPDLDEMSITDWLTVKDCVTTIEKL